MVFFLQEGEVGSPSCERMPFSSPPFGLKPRSGESGWWWWSGSGAGGGGRVVEA